MKNTKEYFIEKYGEETGKNMYVSILHDTFLDEEEAWKEAYSPEAIAKTKADWEKRQELKKPYENRKSVCIGGKWGWLELKK
jgi:spore germination cell wall hydrolase CwlJ-like protein